MPAAAIPEPGIVDRPTATAPDANSSAAAPPQATPPQPAQPQPAPLATQQPDARPQTQQPAAQAEPGRPETPEQPETPETPAVRGPFEPIADHASRASGTASPSADQPAADDEGRPFEFPGLDDDEPAGSAAAALDRLKDLHRTAVAVAPQSLDAHFDQLLARQRRLISEYISESEGSAAPADAPGGDRLVGFGGDLRGTT
jgi:hypothetical protein